MLISNDSFDFLTHLSVIGQTRFQIFLDVLLSPIPWMFLLAGLFLAYLLWGQELLVRLQNLRRESGSFSNQVNEVIGEQNQLLNSLDLQNGADRKKWQFDLENSEEEMNLLNRRLSMLSEASEKARRELSETRKSLSLLEAEHEILKRKDESLCNEVKAREQEVMALQNSLQKQEKEAGQLIEERALLIQNHRVREEEWGALLRTKEEAAEQLTQNRFEMENRINELDLEINHFSEKVSTLEAELLDKQEDHQLLEELVVQRDLEVSQLREEREGFRTALEDRIRDLTQKRLDSEGAFAALKEVEREKNAEIAHLRSGLKDHDGLRSRIDHLEEVHGNRGRELEHLKRERIELENRINELEAAADDKDYKIAVLEEDLLEKQGARQLLDEVDVIIAKHDSELNRLREERETVKLEMEGRVQHLDQQLNDQHNELAGICEEKNALHLEINLLQNELKAREGLRSRIDHLEGVIGDRDQELEYLKRERIELQEGLKSKNLEIEHLREKELRLETLQFEREELQLKVAERENLDLEKRDLEWCLGERSEELRLARKEAEALENEIAVMRREIEEKVGAQSNRIGDLQNLLGDRDRDLECLRVEQDALRSSLAERETELDELRFEKDGLVVHLDTVRNELNSVSNLEPRIRELESILDEKERQIGELRSCNESLTGNGRGMGSRIQELEWLLGERDGELENLRNERAALHHQLGELENIRNEASAKDQMGHRIAELEWYLGERDADLARLRAEREGFLNNQFSAHVALEDDARVAEMNRHIGELERTIEERDRDLSILRCERDQICEALESKSEKASLTDKTDNPVILEYIQRVDDLEKQIIEKDQLLEALRRENETNARLKETDIKGRKTARSPGSIARESDEEFARCLSERDQEILTLRNQLSAQQGLAGKVVDLETQVEERELEVERLKASLAVARERARLVSLVLEEFEMRDRLIDEAGGMSSSTESNRFAASENGKTSGEPIVAMIGEDQDLQIDMNHEAAEDAVAVKALPVISAENAFANDAIKYDHRLGPIFNSRPRHVDDLEKLSGLSLDFAEMLNNFGVYRYKQIALWAPRQLKEIRLLLDINGGDDLETWVQEAIDLHREKYREEINLTVG